MSVRADDAVAAANRAQGFSLRDALGGFVGGAAEAPPRALRMAPPMQAMSHASHGTVRTGERAGEYIAFLIDDPALPQPIRANLFRDDDAGSAWSLHWSRPQKRDGKD